MSVTRSETGVSTPATTQPRECATQRVAPTGPRARPVAVTSGVVPTHTGRFAIADALRGTAILVVVLNHLATITVPVFFGRAFHLRFLGIWGVAAFFVLSGYLLSGPYVRAALAGSRELPSTRLFLARRFLRIVPLYLVAVVLSIAIDLIFRSEPIAPGNVVAHLLMLQDFFDGYVQTIDAPLWTMPVDFEFYLALPIVAFGACAACARFAPAKRTFAFTGILGVIATLSLEYRLFAFGRLDSATQSYFTIMSNLLGMAVIFALGVALALLFELRKGRVLGAPAALGCVVGSGAAFALLPAATAYPSLGSVVAGISVFFALLGLPSFRPVERIAQTRTIAFVASLAYATYLIHFPTLRAVASLLPSPNGTAAFVQLALVALVTIVPGAYLLHRFVERPFLRLKDLQR